MAFEFKLYGTGGAGDRVIVSGKQLAFKRLLASFRDPMTPPRSRTECCHTVEPAPGVILCDGWRTEWSYMECSYYLIVTVPTSQDVAAAVEDCLRCASVAALASALVAVIPGGGGRLPGV